jgi:hypothetical protein
MSFDLINYNSNNILNNIKNDNVIHFIITTKTNDTVHITVNNINNINNTNITYNLKEDEFLQILVLFMFFAQFYILLNNFSK